VEGIEKLLPDVRFPDLYASKRTLIEQSAEKRCQDLPAQTFFPDMKMSWGGAIRNNLGHNDFSGLLPMPRRVAYQRGRPDDFPTIAPPAITCLRYRRKNPKNAKLILACSDRASEGDTITFWALAINPATSN